MQDISGFGTRVSIIASRTFPRGISISAFADDADPIEVPALQIGDKAMGANGNMVYWSTANPKELNISVIPGSEDDRNLRALMAANTPAQGRQPAGDVISATIILPNGASTQLTEGKLMQGPPAIGIASAGRQKSSTYNFAFEGVTYA